MPRPASGIKPKPITFTVPEDTYMRIKEQAGGNIAGWVRDLVVEFLDAKDGEAVIKIEFPGPESGDASGDATGAPNDSGVDDATADADATDATSIPVAVAALPERVREGIRQANAGQVQPRPESSRAREVTPAFKTPKTPKGKR